MTEIVWTTTTPDEAEPCDYFNGDPDCGPGREVKCNCGHPVTVCAQCEDRMRARFTCAFHGD
jgi:hypothetical protein